MYKTFSPRQIGLLLLCIAIVLIVSHIDNASSASVDLAHHYALVFRIWENWQLVAGDPSLGEMNVYPRVSHVIAAILGMLFNSPFLGLQVGALASLALIWGAYLWILSLLAPRAGIAGVFMLGLLVLVNNQFIGFNIHGAELVNNFFYSQLMAHAFAVLCMGMAIVLELKKRRLIARLFLMAGIALLPAVHLLPAVELLALVGGLLLLDSIVYSGTARQRLKYAGTNALLLGVSVASVLLHPAFKVMRGISENNGELRLALVATRPALALLCVACVAMALLLLRSWWRDPARHPVPKYLALYGGGIAMLCLLQIALLSFNFGSDYAVKKYAFGMTSFLLVAIAYYAGTGGAALLGSSVRASRVADKLGVSAVVMGGALYVTFSYCASWNKVMDTSDVVAVERQLVALRSTSLASAPDGKHDIVIDIQGLPAEVSYMFSIGVTHTPRDIAGAIINGNRLREPLAQYHNIVSLRGHSRYDKPDCVRNPSGVLAVTDGQCVEKIFARARVCDKIVDFSQHGTLDPGMLVGFSGAEAQSRWTDSREARFMCASNSQARTAKIFLVPFLVKSDQRQRVAFSVNGGSPTIREFRYPAAPEVIELPLPRVAPGTQLVFKLDLPDAISPDALGIDRDGRQLGVAVAKIVFE